MFTNYGDEDFEISYKPNVAAGRPASIRPKSKDARKEQDYDLDALIGNDSKHTDMSKDEGLSALLGKPSVLEPRAKQAKQSKKKEEQPELTLQVPALSFEGRRGNMRNPANSKKETAPNMLSLDYSYTQQPRGSDPRDKHEQAKPAPKGQSHAKQEHMQADWQQQLKEERTRHEQQLARLQDEHSKEKARLHDHYKGEQDSAKQHYQDLMTTQKEMFEQELKLLQQQAFHHQEKPKTNEDGQFQQFVRELQSKQQASLQFLKQRIAAADRKAEADRQDVRQQRHNLIQREAALKEDDKKKKLGIMKDLDRVIEAQKRVHAQTVQLQSERTKAVETVRRAREETRRQAERERFEMESKRKELELGKQLLAKEVRLLESERQEFENRRARLLQEVDGLRNGLLIRQSDFNAKLRSIEAKEGEAVRMAEQLRSKLTILDLQKQRYQSQIRRMQLLAGRQAAITVAPGSDYLREQLQSTERLTKLDDYFRQAMQEKVYQKANYEDEEFHYRESQSVFLQKADKRPPPPPRKKPDSKQQRRRADDLESYIRKLSAKLQTNIAPLHPKVERVERMERVERVERVERATAKPSPVKQTGQEQKPFSLLQRFMKNDTETVSQN